MGIELISFAIMILLYYVQDELGRIRKEIEYFNTKKENQEIKK